MRILLVEDDAVLSNAVHSALRQTGYAVDHAVSGREADTALLHPVYDLVILDINLPELNGFEVLGRLRRRGSTTPVLFLTARDNLPDRVKGLDLGADDYVVKPFALQELEARVRALVRRSQGTASSTIFHGALSYSLSTRQASLKGQPLALSARELAVLEVLVLRAGQTVGKEQIVEKLCDWGEHVGINAIEVYVHRLRKKLLSGNIQIKTIRGLGYLLEKPHA